MCVSPQSISRSWIPPSSHWLALYTDSLWLSVCLFFFFLFLPNWVGRGQFQPFPQAQLWFYSLFLLSFSASKSFTPSFTLRLRWINKACSINSFPLLFKLPGPLTVTTFSPRHQIQVCKFSKRLWMFNDDFREWWRNSWIAKLLVLIFILSAVNHSCDRMSNLSCGTRAFYNQIATS